MKFIIRMYRTFDLDLISLYKNPNFDFRNAITDALRASARKQILYIKLPQTNTSFEAPSKCVTHIELDDVLDQDVICWLMKITEGYRNTVIKNILRSHFLSYYFKPYMEDDDGRTEATISLSQCKEEQVDYFIRGKKTHKKEQKEVVKLKPENNYGKINDNKEQQQITIENTQKISSTKTLAQNNISTKENVSEKEDFDMFSKFEEMEDY